MTQPGTRERLYSLLGELPPRNGPMICRADAVSVTNGVRVEHLTLEVNGREPVPAWFTRPENARGPLPAVLFCHSHGGNYALGKDELLRGNVYMQSPGYAFALAEAGFAALCPDAWCFGERAGNQEGELFRELLWKGQTLWGAMVYDHLRALDYLCARPDVDPARVGVMGMSMGSTQAWWLAALDTRIRACAELCCLTEFHSLMARRQLQLHGLFYFVPGLLREFGTADICALIAPRAHFALAGTRDPLTPQEGLDQVDEALRSVYAACGAPENWRLQRYDTPHFETPRMRRDVLSFLKGTL